MFCSDNFDDHIKELSVLGTWGDDLEIRALEELLDRVICIYCSDSFNLMGESSGTLLAGDGAIDVNNATHHAAPMKKNFEEDELVGAGVAPISLSYHGQSHYNSVYNEQIPLPLAPRTSHVIMKARMELFNCVVPMSPPDSTNRHASDSPHNYSSPSSAYKSHSSNRTRRSAEGDYRASTRSGGSIVSSGSSPRKASPRSQYDQHDQDSWRGGGDGYDSGARESSRDPHRSSREGQQSYNTPTHSNNANYHHHHQHSSGGHSGQGHIQSNYVSTHRVPSSHHEDPVSRHISTSSSSYVDDEYRRQMEYLSGGGGDSGQKQHHHALGVGSSGIKYRQ
jgi:hypothetical protein